MAKGSLWVNIYPLACGFTAGEGDEDKMRTLIKATYDKVQHIHKEYGTSAHYKFCVSVPNGFINIEFRRVDHL